MVYFHFCIIFPFLFCGGFFFEVGVLILLYIFFFFFFLSLVNYLYPSFCLTFLISLLHIYLYVHFFAPLDLFVEFGDFFCSSYPYIRCFFYLLFTFELGGIIVVDSSHSSHSPTILSVSSGTPICLVDF